MIEQSARRSRWLAVGLAAFFVVDGLVLALAFGHRLTAGASMLFLACVVLARRPIEDFIDRHVRLRDGAWAEEAVGETLNKLRAEGWILMHDVKPEHGANLDHIASGPTGVYVIETKARRYDDAHIGRVMRQARWLHNQLGCFVTPVICLHRRDRKPFRTHGVWVVPHAHLLDWLRAQHNQPVEFERLARFADSL